MQITQTLTTMWVSDLDRSVPWYEALFGRRFDQSPMPSCREWNAAPGAIVQVIADDARQPGRSAVAFVIEDLDGVLATLKGRDIEAGEVQEIADFIRFSILRDPDGNEVTLVESLQQ